MMRYCFILLLLFCVNPYLVWSQTNDDSCVAYTSIRNIKKQVAETSCHFALVSPNNNVHFSKHENEYYIYKPYDKRSLSYYLTKYVVVFTKGHWYVNMERLGIGQGFSKVLTQGEYWVVLSAMGNHEPEEPELKYDEQTGLFTPVGIQPQVRKYMYYALDSKTLEKTPLTFAGMLKLLSKYETLQLQFVKDKYNDDPYVIIQYVNELNRYIKHFEKNEN